VGFEQTWVLIGELREAHFVRLFARNLFNATPACDITLGHQRQAMIWPIRPFGGNEHPDTPTNGENLPV
jgi:hypothetical protein